MYPLCTNGVFRFDKLIWNGPLYILRDHRIKLYFFLLRLFLS